MRVAVRGQLSRISLHPPTLCLRRGPSCFLCHIHFLLHPASYVGCGDRTRAPQAPLLTKPFLKPSPSSTLKHPHGYMMSAWQSRIASVCRFWQLAALILSAIPILLRRGRYMILEIKMQKSKGRERLLFCLSRVSFRCLILYFCFASPGHVQEMIREK